MAFTVTATQSGSSSHLGVFLLVKVLTGAVEAGGASNGVTSGGATDTLAITPAASNSLPVFALSCDAATFGAAATGNTYYDSGSDATDSWGYAHGFYSGTVTAGTPVTCGAGSNTGSDHTNLAAYEIKPSGGTTPAVDASSPALATTEAAAAVTTASFTPPGGAVLAALVLAGGTGAGTGITMTITDTSGLGLTWTQRAVSGSSDNFQPAFIVTATIPAGGISAAAGLASGTGAALNAAIVTSNVTVGPRYAGTATDLGGVYGSWGTPQFATGGP